LHPCGRADASQDVGPRFFYVDCSVLTH